MYFPAAGSTLVFGFLFPAWCNYTGRSANIPAHGWQGFWQEGPSVSAYLPAPFGDSFALFGITAIVDFLMDT